jgi:hypothetical protein
MASGPGIMPYSKAESHLSHLFNFPEPPLPVDFDAEELVRMLVGPTAEFSPITIENLALT